MTRIYPFARIVEIHDADTLKLDVDLGFSIHGYVWIRLADVRAPELREKDGAKAKRAVETWRGEHAMDGFVLLQTEQTAGKVKEIHERMTFIRYVGHVSADDGSSLNFYLRDLGYVDQGM